MGLGFVQRGWLDTGEGGWTLRAYSTRYLEVLATGSFGVDGKRRSPGSHGLWIQLEAVVELCRSCRSCGFGIGSWGNGNWVTGFYMDYGGVARGVGKLDGTR